MSHVLGGGIDAEAAAPPPAVRRTLLQPVNNTEHVGARG